MDWGFYWRLFGFVVALSLIAGWLSGCEAPAPAEPGITGACERSFRPTLEAWEAELGRVPEECAYLDTQVDVQLASEDEIPCAPEAPAELVVGCLHGDVIYLLEGRDDVALIDTSVHEWTHALARCVDGDPDRYHLRGELWAQYGPETVELQAQASAEIGECL